VGPSLFGDPASLAVSPDGRRLYASSPDQETVVRVDPTTGAIGPPINFAAAPASFSQPFRPAGLALTPDGQRLLVTNGYVGGASGPFGNDVAILGLATGSARDVRLGAQANGAPFDVAVTPDQPPVASFTVQAAPPGSPTSFDASSSRVAVGTITSYAWDFGDGTHATTSSPQVTHVYRRPGLLTASVTETDSAGTSVSQTTLGTGSGLLDNGGASAVSSHTFVVGKSALDPPLLGKTVVAAPVFGLVLVRHGHGRFRVLRSASDVTVGSELDTRRGEVRLIVARDTQGTTDTSMVSGGLFVVRQSRKAGPVTSFALSQPLSGCVRTAIAVAARRHGTRHRHITVQEVSGNYATTGQYVATSVEGTIWDTADSCRSSTVKVFQGHVVVRDLVRHTHLTVRAGQSYTAHAR
jgi:PKD repeat protein